MHTTWRTSRLQGGLDSAAPAGHTGAQPSTAFLLFVAASAEEDDHGGSMELSTAMGGSR
jgi:hypothetical protein